MLYYKCKQTKRKQITMIIRDKIEEKSLYFVEQDLPKVTFYEIYRNTQKVFQVQNNFDKALTEWCKVVNEVLSVDNKKSLR